MKKEIKVDADVSGAFYGTGFLLALGMNLAVTNNWWSAIWHGFLSWGYVGYWFVKFLTHSL
ncbi:hypothetical protein [Lactococcus termiticola]|uniref:Uncharacterized protein n=1 Tax=Lactococcus termiticola TaxID=2169526 RepID=A0A2R5HDM8_9LACT|nr:hypothetical protein [Lactococcus termiticola]GBG96177.1 hypothetical protein NtB2_00288 [Lactococcus termiticola]